VRLVKSYVILKPCSRDIAPVALAAFLCTKLPHSPINSIIRRSVYNGTMLEFHLLQELLFVCRRITVNTTSYLDTRRLIRKSQASKVRLTSSESLANKSHFRVTGSAKPSNMSQVNHLTTTLLDFPVEILLDILGHLDVRDLIRTRRVSTKFSVSESLTQSL
jgi:hypothetical protein